MKYDPALDGLRAIAVSVVVLSHADAAAVPGGWAGVDVFFVLSGFLITNILSRELDATGTVALKRFYLRRALRLTPALAVMLLAALLLGLVFGPSVKQVLEAVVMSATYLMNWNRAFNLTAEWALGHTWSLAMEEQFYLLWPAALLAIRARWRLPVTIAAIIAMVAWRCWLALHDADAERTYNGFDTHADALLVGCVLAMAGEPERVPGRAWWSAVALGGLATLFVLLPFRTLLAQTAGLSVAALLSTLTIVCARGDGWLRRLLVQPPLVYTGRISYGFYLWHYLLIFVFRPYLPGATIYVAVAISYLCAMVSFHTVELYFQRFRNRLPGVA